MQYQDPDLYILFESALNSIAPEGAMPAEGAAQDMPDAGQIPGMPDAEQIPVAPEPGPVPMPETEPTPGVPGSVPGLMENSTTNLQEDMLRK